MAAAKELSLCWSCRNAVPDRYGNGCSWSRDAIPVAGWVADLNRKTDSWHVNRCPEYAQDPTEMIRPDMDTNTEAVDRLRIGLCESTAPRRRSGIHCAGDPPAGKDSIQDNPEKERRGSGTQSKEQRRVKWQRKHRLQQAK